MKLFCDIIKAQPGVGSGHVPSALGNIGSSGFHFGRDRSQPMRDKKRMAADRANADLSRVNEAKMPNVALDGNDDGEDIVRASKAWTLPLEIKKVDADQQLIFGWASVVEKDGKLIIDKQGDVIPVEELENAAYEFTLNSRNHGDMHRRTGMGKLVESMVFTKDKQSALGIDLKQVGWWVGFKVSDAELWAAHKRGERPEFSIGGAAIPVKVEVKG
jgi:hypothetical protein